MSEDLLFLNEYPEILAGFSSSNIDGPLRREDMAAELQAEGRCLVWPRQCHTDIVVPVHKEDIKPGILEIPTVDGLVTDIPGVRLTSSHADCLPLYMYDPKHHAIGLIHSGWRGCLAGIGVNAIRLMESEYGTDPADVITYIGPGIGYCCFEVDKDVMEAFTDKYPWAEDDFVLKKEIVNTDQSDGKIIRKYHIDLKGLVSEYLKMEGIKKIQIDPHCTCCGGEQFFSYRRNGTPLRHMAYMELRI